jgi:hypothetical protein
MHIPSAQGPSSVTKFTNGGDHGTKAMAGVQQSSARALTPAV